jgi:hypothetical protein
VTAAAAAVILVLALATLANAGNTSPRAYAPVVLGVVEGPTPLPTQTAAPTATLTPQPTQTAQPTATPTVTNTAAPQPTSTTQPTATQTAGPSKTPKPTATPKPTKTPTPTATPKPTAAPNCHYSYPDFCIPPPPPDLNCPDMLPRTDFTVLWTGPNPDPHKFDRDKDGIGCESD